MRLIRIIPSLLINDNYLVKGEKFSNHKYVGDVYNAVKIFSEKNSHEIILLDINATNKNLPVNIELIKKIKNEIFVPLTVGGGIKNIDQVSTLINEGVEKVCLNTILKYNINIVSIIAKKFGSQSVVASIDVKKENTEYVVYFNNGKIKSDLKLTEYLKILENEGAGEIILTSIDKEGSRSGFDIQLYEFVKNLVNIPIIAHGGASNLISFEELFNKTFISAAAGGSSFVYYGNRKAVLINYPTKKEIQNLMEKYESEI